MTSSTSTVPPNPTDAGATYAKPKPVVRRTFGRQVLHDTFTSRGARFGAIWILCLSLLGVFAPFIANSHPILMKVDGKWSSPMWQHLTSLDLILPVAALTLLVILITRRFSAVQSLVAMVLVIAITAPLAIRLKDAPDSINFQQYRDLERSGRVESIYRTLIPYSPTDRMRDMPERRLSGPIGAFTIGNHTLADGRVIYGRLVEIPGAISKTPGVPDRPAQFRIFTGGSSDIIVPVNDVLKSERTVKMHAVNWLGTETDGADLLSRMIHATRIALSVGLISTGIAITIGVLVGGVMGYFVGRIDLFGMRLIEIFEATPTLLVLITVMAAYGRNIYLMMAVIGLLSWTGTARFVRAEFLRLRKQDFVQAAIASGLNQPTIIYRHVLPNGLTPVLVTATFLVASAILTESILSFLGLGLIDQPSWGQMLNQARQGGQGFVWWLAVFPGLAIFLTVFAYALIGDAMRDALDPKLRKRE